MNVVVTTKPDEKVEVCMKTGQKTTREEVEKAQLKLKIRKTPTLDVELPDI